MDFKKFFSKYGFHVIAVFIFLIISAIYFKPATEGYALKQHDMQQFSGMSREVIDYKAQKNESILWTESMFGGMPTAQIHVYYPGNFFKTALNEIHILINQPISFLFLYLLGFYIFGLCIGLNKWVNLIGAIAFAFSSYNIIILQAGHVTKANAIALLLPVIGAFIMAYRGKIKWGIVLFGLFLSLHIAANHLQITYYSLFLFLGLGIFFLVRAIQGKTLKKFLLTSAGLIGVALIAVIINIGNIKITKDYAKYTIRGGNDLTENVDGTKIDASNENGLDLDYITNWSYGIGESFTFLSPYVKGGASETVSSSPFENIVDNADISSDAKNFISSYYSYWGEQPFTSGPIYFGAIVIFLSIISLFFLKSKIKWAYFAVAVLTIALSWGKNFMGLTELFAYHVPGYNKFRAVTIILTITSMIFPILAALILNQFYKERETLVDIKKKFFIVSAGFIVFLFLVKFVGIDKSYLSSTDQKQFESVVGNKDMVRANIMQQINAMSPADLAKNGIDKNNTQQINQIVDAQMKKNAETYDVNALKTVRQGIFNYSMNRTIIFVVLAFGLLTLFFVSKVDSRIIIAGLGVLILIDLVGVDLNYLSNKEDEAGNYVYWQPKLDQEYPEIATDGDLKILQMELAANPTLNSPIQKAERLGKEEAEEKDAESNIEMNKVIEYEKFRALNRKTNYRVLDLTANPFTSARASYFHKSIGGYHGAKLRNYQNLIEHQLSGSLNFKVLEMLNTKYIIQQNGQVAQNPTTLGNAWLVREVKTFANPDEEIRALGNSFTIQSKSIAKLFVNGKEKTGATTVTSHEKVQLLVQNDTVNVTIPNDFQNSLAAGLDGDVQATFVMDMNKKTDFIPTKMLSKDTSNSFLQLMDLKSAYNFEPSTDAVMLKSEANKLSSKLYSGIGSIKMTSYNPMKLKYDFDSPEKQLAVFSEIYYPDGWKAFVDGKEVPIVKVDYLLRGVEIPAGKHKIEMAYIYPFYKTANILSSVGCVAILLLIGGALWTDRKKKGENVA